MKLRSIRLLGFGQFKNYPEVEFGQGLNVLVGHNEAGKSTLVDAILMLLFGVTKKDTLFRRYRPLDGGNFAAVMVVETSDGKLWRVERDFARGRLEISAQTNAGWTVVGSRSANPILADLGITSLNLCRSTILVSRSDVVIQGPEQKALGQAIAARVTGGETEIVAQKALRDLEQRRRQLQNVEGQELVQRRAELSVRWQELQRAHQVEQELTQQLRAAEVELLEKKEFCQRYAPLVDDYKRYQEARQNLEQAQRRLAESLRAARTLKEQQVELLTVKSKLDDNIRLLRTRLDEIDRQIKQYDQELLTPERLAQLRETQLAKETAQRKVESLRQHQITTAKRNQLAWGLICLGVLLGGLPLVWKPTPLPLLAGILGTVILLFQFVFLWKRARRAREEQIELAQAISGVEFYERELARLSHGQPSGELELQYRQLAQLKLERERLANQLEQQNSVMVNLETDKGINQLIDNQAAEVAKWEKVCAELTEKVGWLDSALIAEWAARLGEINLGELEFRVRSLQVRLEQHQLSVRPAELWEIETELALVEQELADLNNRAEAAKLAATILAEAISEVQSNLVPQIESRASELFAYMTAGRYTGVCLEPTLENLVVWVNLSTGQRLAADLHLSSGTGVQLYFALRIALAEALLAGRKFPLILDDPLITSDFERAERILKLIHSLSCQHQIIWVTKDVNLVESLGDPGTFVRIDI